MFVVANRFHVADAYADEFVDRFSQNADELAEQDGFVRFEVLEPAPHPHGETETHVVKTYWASQEAFHAWTQSEHFRRSHDDDAPEDMFTAENELETHTVAFEQAAE